MPGSFELRQRTASPTSDVLQRANKRDEHGIAPSDTDLISGTSYVVPSRTLFALRDKGILQSIICRAKVLVATCYLVQGCQVHTYPPGCQVHTYPPCQVKDTWYIPSGWNTRARCSITITQARIKVLSYARCSTDYVMFTTAAVLTVKDTSF